MVKSRLIVAWRLFVMAYFLLSFILAGFPIAAQEISSFGIANPLAVNDKIVRDADIVSSNDAGYALSKSSYDPRLFGVVSINPAISFNTNEPGKRYPVVAAGNALVNLSTINGAVKKGDPVTSSPIPGVGMKATESGYIIGYALENFSSDDPREIRKVSVSINKQFFAPISSGPQSRMLDIFRLSAIATYEKPLTVLKYLAAAVVIITGFILGFMTFGRTASLGIEALGRNPLAARMIQFGIIINVIITIVIVLSGFGLAYFILRI